MENPTETTLLLKITDDFSTEYPRCYVPRRIIIAMLTFFGLAIAYSLRANLSVAVVTMIDETHWDDPSKGLLLSSFFWGYLSTQLVGGYLVRKLGAKIMLSFSLVWPAVFTLVFPYLVHNFPALVACRILVGFGEGVLFPTFYSLVGKWSPILERARTFSICNSGAWVGTILTMMFGPIIIQRFGWPFVFYITGALGLVWFIFWLILGGDSPETHTLVHPNEVKYIVQGRTPININPHDVEKEVGSNEAMKKLIKKPAFWTVVWMNLAMNWGYYVLLMWLPTYCHQVLGFSLTAMGIVSNLPYMSMVVVSWIGGKIADLLLEKGMKTTSVRKIFGALAGFGPGTALLALSYFDFHPIMAVTVLAVGVGCQAFQAAGLSANITDIAPKHSSLVIGIANSAGTIPGIVGVYSAGLLLNAAGGSWTSIFVLAAFFYYLGMIVWLLFASSERIV